MWFSSSVSDLKTIQNKNKKLPDFFNLFFSQPKHRKKQKKKKKKKKTGKNRENDRGHYKIKSPKYKTNKKTQACGMSTEPTGKGMTDGPTYPTDLIFWRAHLKESKTC